VHIHHLFLEEVLTLHVTINRGGVFVVVRNWSLRRGAVRGEIMMMEHHYSEYVVLLLLIMLVLCVGNSLVIVLITNLLLLLLLLFSLHRLTSLLLHFKFFKVLTPSKNTPHQPFHTSTMKSPLNNITLPFCTAYKLKFRRKIRSSSL
jgi:hypothetical protein